MLAAHCNNERCKNSPTRCRIGCIQTLTACYCLMCDFSVCPFGETADVVYVRRATCMKPVYSEESCDEGD